MEAQPVVDDLRASFAPERSAPGLLRLIAAQVSGLLGILLAFGLFTLAMLWLSSLNANPLNALPYPWGDYIPNGLALIACGAAAGFFQSLVLRRWIIRRSLWMLVSTAAAALVLLGAVLLIDQVNPSAPPGYTSLSPEQWDRVDAQLTRVGAWLGTGVGLAAGLLVGAAQSFWLSSGRRRWWLASALAWAPLTALIASFLFYVNLILLHVMMHDF